VGPGFNNDFGWSLILYRCKKRFMIFLQLRLVSLNSTQKLDAAKGEQKKVKK